MPPEAIVNVYTVHERESNRRIHRVIGVRLTKDAAVVLADEAFDACRTTTVWVQEWDSDGHWYDSTVVHHRERSA